MPLTLKCLTSLSKRPSLYLHRLSMDLLEYLLAIEYPVSTFPDKMLAILFDFLALSREQIHVQI